MTVSDSRGAPACAPTMPRITRMSARACILAVALAMTAAVADARPFQPLAAPDSLVVPASQSLHPCYRKCMIERAWGDARKFACMTVCRRNPVQQCEDRCFRRWPNNPGERKKCNRRC